jgi:hypothetical protein
MRDQVPVVDPVAWRARLSAAQQHGTRMVKVQTTPLHPARTN